jgi:hypothetical protein
MTNSSKLRAAALAVAFAGIAAPAFAQTSYGRDGYISNDVTGTIPRDTRGLRNDEAQPVLRSPEERQRERGSALVEHPDESFNRGH